MSVLIFGCGYLGARAARLWRAQGRDVWAVTRSEDRAGQLLASGLNPIVMDPVEPPASWRPPAVETVLFSLGFDRSANRSIEDVYVGALRGALRVLGPQAAQRPAPNWIYISTTGVYAAEDGQAADESADCRPQRPGSRASLQAERLLADSGASAWILRMAGLYGPGRIPRAAELRAGQPIAAFPQSVLNLIHIDDAASIVVQAADIAPQHCEILNVSDGVPTTRRDFYDEAARLLGAPPPTFAIPQGAGAARGGAGGKRILTERLRLRFKPQLAYPSYVEGLRQALGPTAD